MCCRIVPLVMSVTIELDQPLVADPEVMRDLVEHDVSDLAAQTIGVAGSESRDRPAEDADLVGKHSAVRAAPSRQRCAAVQAKQRLPVGRLVLDEDLDVAHRRTVIGQRGAQRVVSRLFERVIETRLRTRIHLRNGARIDVGIAAASSWGFVAAVAELTELAALWLGDVTWKSSFSHRNSMCRRLTVTSSRKMSLRGCRPTEVTG